MLEIGTSRAIFPTALLLVLLPVALWGQNENDLAAMSLERLMNVRVSSVSRHAEELRKTAAAVHVITQEDIRRSGVTDLAELLRSVPGLDVAQITANTWAISARGFNAKYANKLLVLVDGRSVYDPLFSGVYWHLQNLVLEDIERIEVIRGPGATMWGANAVNGVISITTKSAANTQGGLFVADAGTTRPGEGSVRFGGTLGKNSFYRAFVKQTTHSSSPAPVGNAGDAWNQTNTGFRVDWNPATNDSIILEGGAYRGVSGVNQTALVSLSPPVYQSGPQLSDRGGHLLASWTHSLKDDSNLKAQFYFDAARHHALLDKNVRVLDFDFQHDFKAGRNRITWGLGHRHVSDDFGPSKGVTFNPSRKNANLSSVFVEDEIAIARETLYLTLGSKFEKNSYTGYEIQPAIRAVWLPSARHSVWAAVSRALRTANRSDRGLRIDAAAVPMGPSAGLISFLGNADTRSEELFSYEAGHRYQANRKLSFDIAAFYNTYNHLSTLEPGTSFLETEPGPAHLVMPQYFDNRMQGETYGAEVAANYKLTDFLSVKSSYSFIRMQLHKYANSTDANAEGAEGETPTNQFYAGSFLTLPKSLEVSSHAYIVSGLPGFRLPAYARVDLNLTWKAHENFEFSVIGQNLLDGSHLEWAQGHNIKRNIFGKISWKF